MQVGNSPPAGATAPAPATAANFLSTFEGQLALVVIALGTLVILALTFLLWKKGTGTEDAIRAYAIVLIIIGTIVLICAGYSNDQIAPAIGLFGTVAGYLLGRKGGQ